MPHVFADQIRHIRGIFDDVWDRDQGGKVSELVEVRGYGLLL